MNVHLLATLDTKGREAAYLRDELRRQGIAVTVIDVGCLDEPAITADIPRQDVFAAAGTTLAQVRAERDRGLAVTLAAHGAVQIVRQRFAAGQLSGLLAIGGSAGTTIATAAMRALPLGVPKLMVSTLASGQVRHYVGDKDILMLNSVVDIAGINRITQTVLSTAARAMAGMVTFVKNPTPAEANKPLVAATMFGVTTACIDHARAILESAGFEVLVFHATGSGGQAMESLIDEGLICGVLDLTTTELADELVGGFLSAGPDRLTAAARRGVPQVVSVGATDMVNFHAPESVPEKFNGRQFYRHNATVTLMRTTEAENRRIGREIGHKVALSTGPAAILLPGRGVSAIDRAGAVFDDPAARQELFQGIRESAGSIEVIELDQHINDAEFATAAANKLIAVLRATPTLAASRSDMSLFQRQEILAKLRAKIAQGKPIIGGGAGTGISAKMSEAGGIDLLVIYNSGRFRMAGRGSLSGMMPYGDANAIVMQMASEVLPVVPRTPVLAGVCGTDPFRLMPRFLQQVIEAGFSGVQNFPTVGLIDGVFRANLEETGMGFGLEVDMIRAAHDLNLLTTPYCFNTEEAAAMAAAGADILIPHMGLTTKGSIGATTAVTLQDAATRVQQMHDAAKRINRNILVLCHGGPIAEPADAQYILDHTEGIVGFYGASSMERLPVEPAISGRVREFTELRFK